MSGGRLGKARRPAPGADGVALLPTLIWRAKAVLRPPVTLGVRLAVFDSAGRTVLVRHTYAAGWHFPGGGVEPGETSAEAAVREFREETGLALDGVPVLFGIYFNRAQARRDHVALYLLRDHPTFDPAALRPQAIEIAEVSVAPVNAPPDGTTGPTARRLAEIVEGRPPAAEW